LQNALHLDVTKKITVPSFFCRPVERTSCTNWTALFGTSASLLIQFCEKLPNDETSKILKRQLLRAGTSVGANYRAACRAKSKPAFISKMSDVLEEADECGYWIELLCESRKVDQKTAAPVLTEANELVAISISSINTAKRNSGGEE